MHPNQHPWHQRHHSSMSNPYQSLDEQLSRLALSSSSNHDPWIFTPSASGVNNNNNNGFSNAGAFSFPAPALTPNHSHYYRGSGQVDRDYYGRHMPDSLIRRTRASAAGAISSSNVLDNIMIDNQYLAMLHYFINNHNNLSLGNRASGFPARVDNPNPRGRSNPIEHRVRNDVHRNNNNNINNIIFNNNNYNRNYNSRNDNYSIVDMRINFDELRGNVANFVKDPQRYKIALQILEKANREEINVIISEVTVDLRAIVVTHTGGQFIQTLLDFCDHQHVTDILRAAMVDQRYFVDICLDNHGSRAMQKLIKKIDAKNAEQKSIILAMMKEVMLTLITNMNSYYFVTELFSSLKGPASYDLITPLFDEIAEHLLEIAVDKFGCCALHICIEHGHRGMQRDRVLHQIVSHALELSENDYGNYVVQYVISKRQEHFSDDIIRSLYGKFAYFCTNKYACYVVEKCILFGANQHLERIIREIMDDDNFLNILLNQTGNYVVQKAITRCCEVAGESTTLLSLFNNLTDDIIAKYPFLHYDRLGKHVLLHAKTEKEKHRRRNLR